MSRKSKVYSKNATSMHTEDTIKEIGDDMELENNDDKFNIEKTDTIDGLAYEQDTSSLLLLLTDGMDWSDMNRHLLLLQDKLNTYIWYIDSGQYKEKYHDYWHHIKYAVIGMFSQAVIALPVGLLVMWFSAR